MADQHHPSEGDSGCEQKEPGPLEVGAVNDPLTILGQVPHGNVGHVHGRRRSAVEGGHVGAGLEAHDQVRGARDLLEPAEVLAAGDEPGFVRLEDQVDERLTGADDRRARRRSTRQFAAAEHVVDIGRRVDGDLLTHVQVIMGHRRPVDDDLVDSVWARQPPGSKKGSAQRSVQVVVAWL